jgi:hypothetical protein
VNASLREQLQTASLAGFNAQDLGAAHAAAAALLSFAEHTQGQALAHVRTLRVERAGDLLDLPPATHRNLELVQTLRGEDSPTLLSLLDTCRSGMGSRRLRHWLTHPERQRSTASQRHDAIAQHCWRKALHRCATRCAASATWNASPPASPCARCARVNWPACATPWPACPRCVARRRAVRRCWTNCTVR